ncbi:hypothetical protein MBRA1_000476 [Malassezia brasiliensis]|uniref:DUF2423 domain-containing protein n=1 Tax=Malassezia brasiliensis TaxID=1821822 RepID=A0AAF0DSB1_9BASI|nr:hypothetical protein MBRA1_000476 [Malassezia brasiliensis]
MAKSLRSHSKLKARNLKRYTAGSDYAVTAAARLNKVASRLQQRAAAPKGHEDDEERMDDEPVQEADVSTGEAQMQEDAPQPPKKISTSGPRGSRNEQWRKAHKVKGSKNNGRAKRRR